MRITNLLLITGNTGKLEEFKKLIDLEALDFSSKSLDLQEVQSFEIEEIGRLKTEYALKQVANSSTHQAVLTDDTGIYCEALNGLPGPLIKWFLEKLGDQGIYDLVKDKNVATTAVCLLTLGLVSTGEIIQFKGEVKGQLVSPRGEGGFGWDKVFLPNDQSKTYGEMTADEKNEISHRTLAAQQLREWILNTD